MPFHIDYRPKTFEDIIGNRITVSSLRRLIEKDDHPHTYLFHGLAGCGKTTAARICVDKLNVHPFMVHEVNSANNRGIDTARHIIEKMGFLPLEGTRVAYIIDEVHKATKEWMNAMLKPLEDTPAHMYFFLCTTERNKLIKALRSRCSEFQFSPLNNKECDLLIDRVGIGVSQTVRKTLFEYSEGRPRDLLVGLEQIVGLPDSEAKKLLGSNEQDSEIIDLCRALATSKSWDVVRGIIKSFSTKDAEAIRRVVLGYAKAILLNSQRPHKRAMDIIEQFRQPTYDIGMPGIVLACGKLSEPHVEYRRVVPSTKKEMDDF